MSSRKERKVPKKFIEKYGDSFPIWSFSRVNSFNNCIFEYYLSRIKKLNSKDNIYTVTGNVVHQIIEDFYNNKIKYNDMIDKFESDFLDIEISDYKFSSDETRNINMRDKYKNCVTHFFKNHIPVKEKVLTEKEIWIDVDGHVFMGYVDAIHKDSDGNIIITDYKTSTIYKGNKIPEQSKQLLLYALGLNQNGIKLDKIKCRWSFLKYVDITYKQKNGKYKTTTAERNKWVEKIKTPLKRDLKEIYQMEDWEADIKIDKLIKENSLYELSSEIKNKYKLNDCYVYIDINEDAINKLKQDLIETVRGILSRSRDENDWQRDDIQPSEEFYCSVLCGQKSNCKYFKDYIKNKNDNMVVEDEIIKDIDELLNL